MAAHPHAALMADYAQDATETDTPWKKWECLNPAVQQLTWENLTYHPQWASDCQYRRKPKTIRIGDIDVPAPLTVAPLTGEYVFVVTIFSEQLFNAYAWDGGRYDSMWMSRGLVHSTKEDAIKHAKALIMASGGHID